MAKFHGEIGYADSKEVTIPGTVTEEDPEPEPIKTGTWVDEISERIYYGDIISESKQWSTGEKANDNLNINNRISIVADDFANANFSAMRYVKWSGVYWKISDIKIQRPRLILTLGGVYNGNTYIAPDPIEDPSPE